MQARAVEMEEVIHAMVRVLVPELWGTTCRTVSDPGIGHRFLQGEDAGRSKWFQLLGSGAHRTREMS